MLCYGPAVGPRRHHNRDTVPRGAGNIYVIEPYTGPANDFQLLTLLNNGGVTKTQAIDIRIRRF